MTRNELGRAAVMMGGVTVGSILALLIIAGRAEGRPPLPGRRPIARVGNATAPARPENRSLFPVSEDVLERYRLAAAV